jgi:hypothetical protein
MLISQKSSVRPARRWESVKKPKKMAPKPRRPPIPNCTTRKLGLSLTPRAMRESVIPAGRSKNRGLVEARSRQAEEVEQKLSKNMDFFAIDLPTVELTPAPLVRPKVVNVPEEASLPVPFSAKLISEHFKNVNEPAFPPDSLASIVDPSSDLPSQDETGASKLSIQNQRLKAKPVLLKDRTTESRCEHKELDLRSEPKNFGKMDSKVIPTAPAEQDEGCWKSLVANEKRIPPPVISDGVDMRARERQNNEKRKVKILDFHSVRPRANKLNKPSPKPRECIYSRLRGSNSGNQRVSTPSSASATSLISEARSPGTCTEDQVSEYSTNSSSTNEPVMQDRGETQEYRPASEDPKLKAEEGNLPDRQEPHSCFSFSPSIDVPIMERQHNGLSFGMLPNSQPTGFIPQPVMSIPNQYGGVPMMYPGHVGSPPFQVVQFPFHLQQPQQVMPCVQLVQPGTYYQPATFIQHNGFYQPNTTYVPLTTDNVIRHNLYYPGL